MEIKKPNRLYQSIRYPLQFLAVIWMVHIVQIIVPGNLAFLGVRPRYIEGLWGILFSPLLHSGFGHLINNSIPFLVLSSMIFFFFQRVAWRSIISIYFLAGVFLWLFGNSEFFDRLLGMPITNGYHIGASGVVYGLVAFIFWMGVFRRNLKTIILALVVLTYYSGMFLGILPNDEGVSWEGHLYGAVAGILVAYWSHTEIEEDEKPKPYSWELEPEKESALFFERDTFDRTKEERKKDKESGLPDWFSTKTWE